MLTTQVEDPSKYGVVITTPAQTSREEGKGGENGCQEWGRVNRFYEKPKEFVTNRVNAGIYIFNKSIIDKIEMRPHFLERDIFPRLAEEGQLFYCGL
jgi:mannose-1-phosphate guanylyltransferase